MKKTFTLPLLLVAFSSLCPYLSRAQIWRPIAGIPSNNCCTFDTSRSAPVVKMGPAGTAYLLYQEYANAFANSVIVTKYNGSAWTPVGNPEFAPSYMGYPDLAVEAGKPIYVGLNNGGQAPDVWSYTGAPWSQVSPPANSPANTVNSPVSMVIDQMGKPWCAFYNGRTNSPSVFALNSGAWSDIAPGIFGATTGTTFVEIAVDYNNNPYVVFDQTNPSGGAPLLFVKRYIFNEWQSVGTKTLYSTGSNHVLAFDNGSNPYIIADDPTNGNSLQLMWFTGSDWTPAGPAPATTASVQTGANHLTQLYLTMGAGNIPMVCYWSNVYDPSVFGYPVSFVKLSSPVFVPSTDTAWVPAADTTLAFEATGGNQIAFSADTLGHAILATTYYTDNPDINAFELFPGNPPAVITFSAIDTVYGTPDFAPGATSTNTDSGDPITYTIADTTIATMVNGKIHILQGGTTTITALQAADKNFKAAVPVTVHLIITPAGQTITFPGWPQKKVGDPDFPAGAYSSSGLPVTYDGSDPTIATVSPGGTIHIIEQGAIIVTAHQAGNSSYAAAPDLEQVLIINAGDTTGSDTTNAIPGDKQLVAYCTSPSSLLVQVTPPGDGTALLEVFNSSGNRLYSKQIAVTTKGNNVNTVPVGEMPEGIYFVRVVGNGFNMHKTIWIR